MNISTSECSSGCESGWTTYLDQLSNSTNPYKNQNYQEKGGNVNDDDEEDEDLSMVSDASSGPPNLQENYGVEHQIYSSAASLQQEKKKSKQKSNKKETKMMKKNHHSLCLDDTASSPFLHFSQGNAVPHENHNSVSTAHFEDEHMSKKNVGFFKSSTKGKSGSLLGRKRQ